MLRTGWPFCCAERDSRRLKTSPPTEHSRHRPHLALPPQNEPLGCIIKTPLVVRPSISTLSCHFVAFSCKQQWSSLAWEFHKEFGTVYLRPRIYFCSNQIRRQRFLPWRAHIDSPKCGTQNEKSCSALPSHPSYHRATCPLQRNQWAILTSVPPKNSWAIVWLVKAIAD